MPDPRRPYILMKGIRPIIANERGRKSRQGWLVKRTGVSCK